MRQRTTASQNGHSRRWSSDFLRLTCVGGRRLVAGGVGALLVTFWSLAAAQADTVGVPWTGPPGITETVSQIMAREARHPSTVATFGTRETHPRRVPKSLRLLDPVSPLVTPRAAEESPVPRSPNGQPLAPQALSTSFLGAQASESIYVPPDSMGAVGPSQVLVIVNGRIKVFDKSGNLGALNSTTDNFFTSVRNGSAFDPHVRYDRLSQRWFITMLDFSIPNHILIAVSSGPLITDAGSFTFFQFQHDQVGTTPNADTGNFADYDTLGVDKFALYIGVNMFTPADALYGTTGFVVNKSSLLAGSPVVTAFRRMDDHGSGAGVYTPLGVQNDDPNATEGYFIGPRATINADGSYAGDTGALVLRRISDPGGTPTISSNLLVFVPTISQPVYQVHRDSTSGNLDAVDFRLFSAAIFKNKITGASSLWTAHNIRVNRLGNGSSFGDRNGSRWYEIGGLTTTPTNVQSGTLFDTNSSNPRGFWIPSVAASGQGHMALGCSYASVNDYPGVAVAGRLRTDTPGFIQSPTLAVVSSTAYNLGDGISPHRWGDYSQTVVDPNDDMTMWTFQEYCNDVNSWGVQAVQLQAPPPATPASVSPASLVQGRASVNVVLTGTSAAGTEFFDPGADAGGPGYANHITAAVNGGGVTVNSISFSDPTHITLNVTVAVGAALGARTITVTNPDGQSATSGSGLLTIATPATVVGRKVFYNHSAWDGNDPTANANDDNAIAPDKTALLPGGTATFTNYTSYSRGLNGIMVDLTNLPGTPTASDFTFKTGNDNNPAGWSAAPAPVSITARDIGGGVTRLTLIWNDNNLDGVVDANEAVAKKWLEVTVKATANTGLAADDVFFFGNAVGDSGDTASNAQVALADEIGARNNPRNFLNPAPLDNVYDYNRDQRVDLADEIIARNNGTTFLTALKLIDLTSFNPAPSLVTKPASATAQTLTIQQHGTEIWISCPGSAQITPVLTTAPALIEGPWPAVNTAPIYSASDATWSWQFDLSSQPARAFYRLAGP